MGRLQAVAAAADAHARELEELRAEHARLLADQLAQASDAHVRGHGP